MGLTPAAMQAAALLNGQPMGGKHRSAHRHDLWSLKYLSGFQWDQLTDEIGAHSPPLRCCCAQIQPTPEVMLTCELLAAYQNAVRDQKLAHEISAAKRERDFYLSRVDKAKAISAQQERKRKVPAWPPLLLAASWRPCQPCSSICGAQLALSHGLC